MPTRNGEPLNARLSVNGLKIYVPLESDLYRSFGYAPAEQAEARDSPGAQMTTYLGVPAKVLEGHQALEHALRVHRAIHDQVLRLPTISGVDVGFAVLERKREFDPLLAIRAHVAEKRSSEALMTLGLPSITSLRYLLRKVYERAPEEAPTWLWQRFIRYLPRYKDDEPASRMEYCQFKEKLEILQQQSYWDELDYPVPGLSYRDFDCHLESENNSKLRLTVCGVPIDVLGVQYRLHASPQGRASRTGVFVGERRTAAGLPDREQQIIGRDRVEPLAGGVSVGSTTGQVGTLGAVVWDRTDGSPCILSNWHVLAGNTSAGVGQPCSQPSQFDGGTTADTVAHLERWHIGRHGDAALAKLNGDRSFVSGEILGMWHPISGMTKPGLNLEVRKWGRTTGFTEGFVDGIQLTVDISYSGQTRRFENQFHIAPLHRGRPFSQPGDSGSLVLTNFDLETLDWCFREVDRACRSQEARADLARELRTELGRSDVNEKGASQLVENLLIARQPASKLPTRAARDKRRAYLAVGLIFAGDTPGSPLGEFAIASDIQTLAEELKFSLRPVFAPRSSFREVIMEGGSNEPLTARSIRPRVLAPSGLGSDPRGQGPTPDPEESQSGGG